MAKFRYDRCRKKKSVGSIDFFGRGQVCLACRWEEKHAANLERFGSNRAKPRLKRKRRSLLVSR